MKIKLNIDDLAVESFATTNPPDFQGTVIGAQESTNIECTGPSGPTCQEYVSCVYHQSCGAPENCPNTWLTGCPGGHTKPWTDYSCVNLPSCEPFVETCGMCPINEH